ncbi:MAG: HAMP domain-containing sensor histidine kinase [Nannocystaceae bacterium]
MRLRLRLALTAVAVAVPLVAALFVADARSRHDSAAGLLAQIARSVMTAGERERCEAAPASWGGEPLGPPEGPGGGLGGPPEERPLVLGGGPPRLDAGGGGRAHAEVGPGGPPSAGGPGPRPPGKHGPRDMHAPGDGPPHVEAPKLYAYDAALVSANSAAPELGSEWAAAIAGSERGWPARLWPGERVEVLVRTPWGEGPCAFVLARGTTTAGWVGSLVPADPLWLLPLVGVLVGIFLAAGPIVRRILRLGALVRASAEAGFAAPVVLDGDDELAELSRAFDAAASAVREQLAEKERRERTLREFVANTTHDVMTPLTALADHLTSLEESAVAGEIADPAVLTAAVAEVQYLGSIIDNLAIAAKLDAGEPGLVRGPVDLGALAERVVARHRTIARRRGVALEVALPERPLVAAADVTLLEQAIGNLVDNAIRYNHRGGHVALLAERPRPGRFRVRVLDDGPGIAATELSRLLERGARGQGHDARTRTAMDPTGERPGQGLGLAIVVQVAARHGFDLDFDGGDGLRVDLCGDEASPEPAP